MNTIIIFIILCCTFRIIAQEDVLVLPVKHSSYITKFIYTFDKRYVYTASQDKTIKLWYFNGAYLIRTFYGHRGEITDIAVNNNNTKLFSSDNTGLLIVWNTHTSEILHKIYTGSPIKAIYFDEKENKLLVSKESGTIDIFETTNMNKLKALETKPYYAIKILPSKNNNQYFLGFCKIKNFSEQFEAKNGNVQMYDARLDNVFPLCTYTDDLIDITLSPDSSKLVTISKENNMVRIWDTNKLIEENSFKVNIKPRRVFLARNNKLVGVGAFDNSEIRGYRISGEEILSFSIDTGFTIFGEFNKDITRIHALNNYGQFKIFDFQGNVRHIYGYYASVTYKITASSYQQKHKIMAFGYEHGKIIFFNLFKSSLEHLSGTESLPINFMSFDSNNPWLAVVHEPQILPSTDENPLAQTLSNITIYDYEKQSIIFKKSYSEHYITAIDFCNSLLFIGFNDGELEIWDMNVQKKLSEHKITPFDITKIKSVENKYLFIQTIDNQILYLQLLPNYTTKLIKSYQIKKDEYMCDVNENLLVTNLQAIKLQTHTSYPIFAIRSLTLNNNEYVILDNDGLKLFNEQQLQWTKEYETERPQNIIQDKTSYFIGIVYPFSRVSFYNAKNGDHLGDLFIPDSKSWVFANNLNYDACESALLKINIVKGIVFNRNVNKEENRIKDLLPKSLGIEN